MNICIKLGKGCVVGMLTFMIIILMGSILLSITNLPMSSQGVIAIIATAIACGIVGMFTGSAFGKRGLILGLISGFIFEMVIITLLMLVFSVDIFAQNFEFKYIIPMMCGAFCGSIGTNIKK